MRGQFFVLGLLALTAALAGCGGGGGDAARPALLAFNPSTVTANVRSGTSATLTVLATASDAVLKEPAIFVVLVDSAQVLVPGFQLASVDARTTAVTVQTSPTLAVGRYQGSFQVHVCKDLQCRAPLADSPVSLPYDLTIAPAPLDAFPVRSTTATVHQGGSLAQTVAVRVSGPPLAWTATASAPWIRVEPAMGTGPGTFSIGYDTAQLAQGRHDGVVTVRASDGQTVAVPVSVQVLPTEFSIVGGMPTFAAVKGAPIAPQTLSVALNNDVPSAWSSSTSAPWLIASPLTGTTPAVVTLQPDPSRGNLAVGAHTAELVLSAAGVPSRTVPVQLQLARAQLSLSSESMVLGGLRGRDLNAGLNLMLTLNTGTNSWPFRLENLPNWLQSSTTTGQVNQSGTSLLVKPRPAGIAPGTTTGSFQVSAEVQGETVSLPVTVTLQADERRLLPSAWAVSFVSTPTSAVLTRTLSIEDNFTSPLLPWSAQSDAAWLSVTANGSTPISALTLTADPSSLPSGVISHAQVTVSTSAAAGVKPAVIRVALWKDSTGLVAVAQASGNYTKLVADPLRPYVYAHEGGSRVDVFHAHTGQRLTSMVNLGAALGEMSVSPDGRRLYALDTASRAMAVVDLATQSLVATWPLNDAVNERTPVLAIKPNGVEVVLVGTGSAFVDGRSLPTGLHAVEAPLVATANGKQVYTLGRRHSLDFSAMSGGVLFVESGPSLNLNSGGNARDLAVSPDGRRVISASGGGVNEPGRYRCGITDGVTGEYVGSLPGGDAYPNNVEFTVDGRQICGISFSTSEFNFWVHAPNGALLKGYKVGDLRDRQLVATADGAVAVALTSPLLGAGGIVFVPILER